MHPVHTVVFVLFIPISMALTLFWFRLYILERWGFLDYFRHFGLASIYSWFLTPYISPVCRSALTVSASLWPLYGVLPLPYSVLLPMFQSYPHCLLRNYLTQSNHFFSIPSLPPPSHPAPKPKPKPPVRVHPNKRTSANLHTRIQSLKFPPTHT